MLIGIPVVLSVEGLVPVTDVDKEKDGLDEDDLSVVLRHETGPFQKTLDCYFGYAYPVDFIQQTYN